LILAARFFSAGEIFIAPGKSSSCKIEGKSVAEKPEALRLAGHWPLIGERILSGYIQAAPDCV
jgi:hypothetical protein